MNKSDKRLFINALVFPFLFIVIMWAVKLIEIQFDLQNIIREFGVSQENFLELRAFYSLRLYIKTYYI